MNYLCQRIARLWPDRHIPAVRQHLRMLIPHARVILRAEQRRKAEREEASLLAPFVRCVTYVSFGTLAAACVLGMLYILAHIIAWAIR